MRLLWAGDENGVSFDGEFFSFRNLCSFPKALGSGTLPIHVGGASRAAARRAGQRGDGYFPGGQLTAGERASQLDVMRTAAAQAGRDPALLEYTRWVPASITAADAGAQAALGVTRLVAALGPPLLVRALNYLNTQVGRMVAEIRSQGLASSTALIISAKHGRSPTDPGDLKRVPDAPVIAAVNAARTAAHPGTGALVIFSTDDDGMLWWLSDRSQAAADFVKQYLLTHSAAGNNISGNPVTVPASGLTKVYAGAASAAYFGVPNSDPRHPDIFGIVQHGVVYTGGQSKIAEHGGAGFEDRNVPILVDIPGLGHGEQIGTQVETTQIAPTILDLLGLNPQALRAVQIEHTKALPGLPGGWTH